MRTYEAYERSLRLKLALLAICLLTCVTASACGGGSDSSGGTVLVEVGGTPGTRFSGTIGSPAWSQAVESVVPDGFKIPERGSNGVYTVFVQKQDDTGALRVTLHCPGGPQVEETTVPHGAVTVSCSPAE